MGRGLRVEGSAWWVSPQSRCLAKLMQLSTPLHAKLAPMNKLLHSELRTAGANAEVIYCHAMMPVARGLLMIK